jgi:signal transduction histidine kinase
MRVFSITRPLVAILLLAMALVVVSGMLELTSAVRLAASQAAVEAGLVARSVQRELARELVDSPDPSLETLGEDVRLRETLRDGIAWAPSIVDIAVIDPEGRAVAHTQPALVGTVLSAHPPLPVIHGLGRSLSVLWSLWRAPEVYQTETVLRRGEEPFATIRVSIAGSFLWEAVRQATGRGLAAATIVISLAALAGVLLGRLALGRVRVLEDGIDAIRTGRFEQPLPESGADEFSRLARALNLLGAQGGPPRDANASSARAENATDRVELAELSWADQSRVLARLGQTATGVAHELRNQLQRVQFDLDELRKGDTMAPELMRRRVESAAQGVQSLGGAVRGFLKVARVRPLAPEAVRVNELLGQILRELEAEAMLAGVDLTLEADPGVPETLADPEVLRQAVYNLVRNSLQALTDREGTVTIRTSVESDRLRISVADDGPGIPPEVLDRVFDLYFTTRLDGSGVGLALVRQAAEMHGGLVAIDSAPGTETVVTIDIPVRRAPPTGVRP